MLCFPANTLAIFVKPPTIEEMERRLRGRPTDSEEKIKERVAKAEKELSYAKEFDQVLINDDLEIVTHPPSESVPKLPKGHGKNLGGS